MTSQSKVCSLKVHQIERNPFSHQDVFLFMKRNIKTNGDKKLKEITEFLEYHPLAINQAIKYINNNTISLEEYIVLFRSSPVKILEECFPTEADTKFTITSIILILNKIKTSPEKLLEILNHLSYCDGRNITKRFITNISKY